jgi:hypothetical protein
MVMLDLKERSWLIGYIFSIKWILHSHSFFFSGVLTILGASVLMGLARLASMVMDVSLFNSACLRRLVAGGQILKMENVGKEVKHK